MPLQLGVRAALDCVMAQLLPTMHHTCKSLFATCCCMFAVDGRACSLAGCNPLQHELVINCFTCCTNVYAARCTYGQSQMQPCIHAARTHVQLHANIYTCSTNTRRTYIHTHTLSRTHCLRSHGYLCAHFHVCICVPVPQPTALCPANSQLAEQEELAGDSEELAPSFTIPTFDGGPEPAPKVTRPSAIGTPVIAGNSDCLQRQWIFFIGFYTKSIRKAFWSVPW